MKVYIRAIIRYFCFYSLAFFAFMLLEMLIHNIYSLLSLYYPDAVPRYDEITSPEDYARLSKAISLLSSVFSIVAASFVSTHFDNERFEHIITKTDGFYKVSEGTALYLKRYLLPDSVASVLAPIPTFFLGFIALPERPRGLIKYLIGFFENFVSMTGALTGALGLVLGLFTAIFIGFLSKLILAPYAALRYRARWLSNI